MENHAHLRMKFTSSIAEMEAEFQYEYARERNDKDGFVYCDRPHLMRELDDFCDQDKMHTKQGPMLILGDAGAGKSALLVNWMAKRKKNAQTWSASFPEFLFYHAVGCTRQSSYVPKLLSRLLSEMKEYFELSKEIPVLEEKLNWEFPRFLEAAARKGRVIIMIDGLHRLQTNEGEGFLRWLPLSFPPRVRVIFTGTLLPNKPIIGINGAMQEYCVVDSSNRKTRPKSVIHRVQIEASRRKWRSLTVRPLACNDRKTIITQYVSRCNRRRDIDTAPFLLYPLQQEAIACIQQTENLRFLNMLLLGLAWAAKETFDIHVVLKEWITASDIDELCEGILRSMENGYQPTQKSIREAHELIYAQGIEDLQEIVRQEKKKNVPNSRFFKDDLDSNEESGEYENDVMEKTTSWGLEKNDVHPSHDSVPDQNKSLSSTTALPSDSNNRSSIHLGKFPLYLKGGTAVKGLRYLLEKSLSLLYVCRHGLHESELYIVLQSIMREEKRSCDISVHIWSRLKHALTTLGVLFQQHVFVIPLSEETLRDLIWCRYITSENTEQQKYHHHLIQYYAAQPPSFRRAESLPWHLHCCNRWVSLRDTLIDINMFRLLFTTSLKTELFYYWKLLNEVPVITRTSDVSKMTISFDIIKEYCKGIDGWHHQTRSSTANLTALLNVMTKFIYEFCCFSPCASPQFLHPTLDLSSLERDGVILPELPQANITWDVNYLYNYYRWMWIQFPWIALTHKLVLKENESASSTQNALINKEKALKMRKINVLTDQKSWDLAKKRLKSSNEISNYQVSKIIHSTLAKSMRCNVKSIIDPNAPINRQMRRGSSQLTMRNTSNLINAIKSSTQSNKSISESKSEPYLGESTSLSNCEWDSKEMSSHKLLYKLKDTYNEVILEKRRKQKQIEKLKQRFNEKNTSRQNALKQADDGHQAMNEMTSRMTAISNAIEQIELNGALCSRVINACIKYAPSNKPFVMEKKKKLDLMTLTYQNLDTQLGALRYGNLRIINCEIPTLETEYAKSQELYVKIVANVDQSMEDLNAEKVATDYLYDRRKDIIEAVQDDIKDLGKEEEKKLEKEVHVHAKRQTIVDAKTSIVKSALLSSAILVENIKTASGISNLEVMYEKLLNRDGLNNSLKDQEELYQSRLRNMKSDQREIEAELQSIRLQSMTTVEDARKVGHSLRGIESKVMRSRNENKALTAQYKETVIGLSLIAKLLGITSVDRPRENLVPAEQLWPPLQNKILSAELCAAEPLKIEQVIKVCEERAVAITEMLEHGRGNPDKGFAVKNLNQTPKQRRRIEGTNITPFETDEEEIILSRMNIKAESKKHLRRRTTAMDEVNDESIKL